MSYPEIEDLERVNREVNALPYRSDADRYGLPGHMAEIDAHGGDCEDYALAKLNRLRRLGWPLEALRLATCYTDTGEHHAVLDVTTYAGETRILSNGLPWPLTLEDLQARRWTPGYIQAEGGSQTWKQWLWRAKPQAS